MRALVLLLWLASGENLPDSEITLAKKAAAVGVQDTATAGTNDTVFKEALAAADAAGAAIELSDPTISSRVVERAEAKAELEFSRLANVSGSTMTAAEDIAEVVVADVDQSLTKDIGEDIVQAAEAAAVVAQRAVHDHPDNVALAKREAELSVNNVVTAESVAAAAARAAVTIAMAATGDSQEKEALAAANAAINAAQAVDHTASWSDIQRAQLQAKETYDDAIKEKVPKGKAARDAARTAVMVSDPSVSDLLKQAAEAAAEAAVIAITANPDNVTAAEIAAGMHASKIVKADKIAAKSAIEAVTNAEGRPQDDQMTEVTHAAADAIMDVMEAENPELGGDQADKVFAAASKAFLKALKGNKPLNEAAEKGVEAASGIAQKGAKNKLDPMALEAAAAAAHDAAQAVFDHPHDQAMAVQEATAHAADDLEEEMRHGSPMPMPEPWSWSKLAFWAAVAVAVYYGYQYYGQQTHSMNGSLLKKQSNEWEAEGGHILMTEEGFQPMRDQARRY